MLGIILGIVKITGILLLCLFLLLLILLSMVLFIPLRYRGRILYEEGLLIDSKISWCLSLVSLEIKFEERLDIGLRLLGFRLRGKKKAEEEPEEDVKEEDLAKEEQKEKEALKDPREEENLPKEPVKERQEKPVDSKRGRKKRRKKSLLQKCRESKQRFLRKTEYLLENIEKLKKTVRSKRLKRGLKKIWIAARKLLRHIWIRRIRGRIRFGFEDPYATGQALSYAALFYPAYRDSIELIPFFDREIMEADIEIRGRAQIFYVLWVLGRLWFDKDFKFVYKKFRAFQQ